jgi:hypothetical protein
MKIIEISCSNFKKYSFRFGSDKAKEVVNHLRTAVLEVRTKNQLFALAYGESFAVDGWYHFILRILITCKGKIMTLYKSSNEWVYLLTLGSFQILTRTFPYVKLYLQR